MMWALPLGLFFLWGMTLMSNPAGLAPAKLVEAKAGESWRFAPYDEAKFLAQVPSIGTVVKTETFPFGTGVVTWYTVLLSKNFSFKIGDSNIRSATRGP